MLRFALGAIEKGIRPGATAPLAKGSNFIRKALMKGAAYTALLAIFKLEAETSMCLFYKGLLGHDDSLWRSALANVPLAQSAFAFKLEKVGNIEDAFVWYATTYQSQSKKPKVIILYKRS